MDDNIIAAQRDALSHENARLRAEIERLRKALIDASFYANNLTPPARDS